MSDETHLIEGTVKAVTELAILIDDGGDEVWIPLSQIVYGPDEFERDDEVEIEIPLWLAEAKGLV